MKACLTGRKQFLRAQAKSSCRCFESCPAIMRLRKQVSSAFSPVFSLPERKNRDLRAARYRCHFRHA